MNPNETATNLLNGNPLDRRFFTKISTKVINMNVPVAKPWRTKMTFDKVGSCSSPPKSCIRVPIAVPNGDMIEKIMIPMTAGACAGA